MLEAAIQNGADAVYFGVPHWNARGRTEDFSFDEVGEMIRYARLRGVRTFLAMNVLVFERELQELPEFLEHIIALEPDAFIIQDIGLTRLIRAIAPNQEVHASTQMTLASAEAVNLIAGLGFNRAVLARELSAKQIAEIKAHTPLEIEVFVHGALCVSYSGQCLTSENFGGRSANRGQCAQSCRLPYSIFVDGKEFRETDAQYLFSTRDLCALPKLEELLESGVESLKVEGRLKSPEYVAAVTKAYRKAIDNLTGSGADNGKATAMGVGPASVMRSKSGALTAASLTAASLTAADMEPLEVLFSRGLGTGWLDGVNHQQLVNGTFSNHHGELLGDVEKVDRSSIVVRTVSDFVEEVLPQPGDGILFENFTFGTSTGGRLFKVSLEPRHRLRLEFGRDFDLRQVSRGMQAFRNDSPALEKNLRKTFTDRELFKHDAISMVLFGSIGNPLRLTAFDNAGHKVQVESESVLESAKNAEGQPEQELLEKLRNLAHKELSALSTTPYSLAGLDIQIPANAYIPGKILRTLRQSAVAALDQSRLSWHELQPSAEKGRKFLANVKEVATAAATTGTANATQNRPQISVLVRNPNQIEALAGMDIDKVIMDFDWGVKYDESLAQIREYGFKAGMATLRIHKPGENHYLKNILRLAPDFALIRNLGSLSILKESGIPLQGDYSLNAANSASYDWLLNQGLETLHPSWDLNSTQLFDLLENIDGSRLELSLHQYMPAFHSEYCAFARALTDGRRFPECGKICTQHKVEILDHKGERHFLQSDAECRNTLFVGKPQSALKLLPKLRDARVNNFRLELLDESSEAIRKKVQTYVQAIRGKMDIDAAIRLAGVQEKYGLSEGQLFNESVWENRKKV